MSDSCQCGECDGRKAQPAPVLCQCPDCLAHRDPAEYGDRAKMVAAIEELRGALKRVLEEADSVANAHIETEFCGSRFAVFVLPDAVATRAEAALKSTARWAHDA